MEKRGTLTRNGPYWWSFITCLPCCCSCLSALFVCIFVCSCYTPWAICEVTMIWLPAKPCVITNKMFLKKKKVWSGNARLTPTRPANASSTIFHYCHFSAECFLYSTVTTFLFQLVPRGKSQRKVMVCCEADTNNQCNNAQWVAPNFTI